LEHEIERLYEEFEPSVERPIKKQKSESETIASMAGGNNGLGSAIIICKFNRLMHYYRELEGLYDMEVGTGV
jgi:hypothetical protein